MSKTNQQVLWEGREQKYWSYLDYWAGTYCGLTTHCGCKPVGRKYEITPNRVTEEYKEGGICGCCKTVQIDNVPLTQTTDADVKSVAPPLYHMICCGARRDEVTIRDTSGSKEEVHILYVKPGEGKIVANHIIDRA